MQTHRKITQLLHLHERAEFHSAEYKRLLGGPGRKGNAFKHLEKAEQLRSRISEFIRKEFSGAGIGIGGANALLH